MKTSDPEGEAEGETDRKINWTNRRRERKDQSVGKKKGGLAQGMALGRKRKGQRRQHEAVFIVKEKKNLR